MQLSVIQFTIKLFHTGFMPVLILQSLKYQYYKIFKTLKPASEILVLRADIYRDADKSLARPGRKQATATEDFEFHMSYL